MTASELAATRVVGGVIVTPAMPGDVCAILDLVEAVHLPSEGIAEAMEYFWVARTLAWAAPSPRRHCRTSPPASSVPCTC